MQTSHHGRSRHALSQLTAGCAVFALALGLVGTVGMSTAQAEDVIVGLVTKTEVNPFFVKMRQAAEAEAQAKGLKLIARAGKFDGDNEGQVAAIEDLISAGAKGILVTPNNSSGMLTVIKKARDAGVLVIALDTATDPADAVDATFATDNFEAGVQQGAYAKAALGDKKPVIAMLDGTPGGTVDTFRHDGFLKGFGIAEGDPAIAGAAITNGAQDKGQVGMENLLSKNGDINVVYTINEPAAARWLSGAEVVRQGRRRHPDLDRRRLRWRAQRQGRHHRGDGDAVPLQDGLDGRRRGGRVRGVRQEAHRLRQHRLLPDHRQADAGPRLQGQ